MNNSSYTSLILKLSGVIFIVSALFDFISFAIPLQWQDVQWQIRFVTAIVDRGIVPMLGMILILVAYWLDSTTGIPAAKKKIDLRLPTFAIATVLGLIFLLFVPVHFKNLDSQKNLLLEQINQGAGQGAEQIKGFLTQINTLSQNPNLLNQQIEQRNQIIASGQVQGQPINAQQLEALRQQRDQLQGLRDLSKNPPEFKKRVETIKKTLETQLLERQNQAESSTKLEALKQALRIGLSSLMLAIGYSAIGWLGFAIMRNTPTVKR